MMFQLLENAGRKQKKIRKRELSEVSRAEFRNSSIINAIDTCY